MNLYKRGRIWWIKYMVDGVMHYQSTRTTSKREAEAWMRNIETARRMPTFEDAVEVLRTLYRQEATRPGTIALDDAWRQYSELAAATGKDAVSVRTLRERRQCLDRFRAWLKKEAATIKTAEAVTGPIAARFAASLKNEGLASQSRRNIIGNLSTLWKLLAKVSAGCTNPWLDLKPRDTDGKRGKAFGEDDERRVLEAAKTVGKDWHAVCTIMRHTGLRYSDVARLEWRDIDGDVIRLSPHKTARHGVEVALPITGPVRAALAETPKRGDWVFPLHAETWTHRSAASYKALNFKEVLRVAGLDDAGYTIHSWRHTAATRLAGAGVDIETRKRILGHTVDATARRYDHDEHLDEVRAAIEAAAQ